MFLLFLVSFYSFLVLPLMPLWAQGMFGTDIIAPTIQHEPDTRPAHAGDSLTIQASVSDNMGVEKITFFYRETGWWVWTIATVVLGGVAAGGWR